MCVETSCPTCQGSSDSLRLVSAEFLSPPTFASSPPTVAQLPLHASLPCRLPLLASAHLPGLSLVSQSILTSLWPPLTQTGGAWSPPSCLKGPGALPSPHPQPMHCSSELLATHAPCCLSPALPSILQAVRPPGGLPREVCGSVSWCL